MHLKGSVGVKPHGGGGQPALEFTFQIAKRRNFEATFPVSGWLRAEDGALLCRLEETTSRPSGSVPLFARGLPNKRDGEEDEEPCVLVGILDKHSLQQIEARRLKEKKRDVKFVLDLSLTSLASRAAVSPVFAVDPMAITGAPARNATVRPNQRQPDANWKFLIYHHDGDPVWVNHSALAVLSSESDGAFAEISRSGVQVHAKVSASDWVQDFAPALGLGSFFIVEVPDGRGTLQTVWSLVEDAERSLRQWNTKGAYAHCREAGVALDGFVQKSADGAAFFIREKWRRAYERFNELASLDLHLEDVRKSPKLAGQDLRIGPSDVEHLLVATKALVAYAGRLVEEEQGPPQLVALAEQHKSK